MAKMKDLKPNPKNPRTITDEKLAMLKKSLAEFGDLGGFVFNRKTKRLVGGHQRAKIFTPETEIVIERSYKKPTRTGTLAEGYAIFEGERFKYREVAWDEIREKAANIAANKGAGEWDVSQLAEWFQEIGDFGFDLDLTMFDEAERDSFQVEELPDAEDEEKDNALPPVPKVAKSKRGDLYLLGKHRLVCGDSTSLDDLGHLMEKEKATITFTSPPYNANTKFSNTKNDGALYENYSDDLPSEKYVEFASTVLGNAIAYTRDYVFWNVNYNSNSRAEFIKQIIPYLGLLDETIAWKKTALPVPYGLTRTWEPIFVFRCHKDERRITQDETAFNYWEINNSGALDKSHRAAFPVALPSKAIELIEKCESVLDLFGGSGTTMIAAEKRKKKCYMMELDPVYCDVIVARWEKFTGKKAKLVRGKEK